LGSVEYFKATAGERYSQSAVLPKDCRCEALFFQGAHRSHLCSVTMSNNQQSCHGCHDHSAQSDPCTLLTGDAPFLLKSSSVESVSRMALHGCSIQHTKHLEARFRFDDAATLPLLKFYSASASSLKSSTQWGAVRKARLPFRERLRQSIWVD